MPWPSAGVAGGGDRAGRRLGHGAVHPGEAVADRAMPGRRRREPPESISMRIIPSEKVRSEPRP
jgi:hypothetical protein